MSEGLRPIRHAVELVHQRATARDRIDRAWPHAEPWFLAGLTRVLTSPRATSDALLIVADGLEEMRQHSSAAGRLCAAAGLERLAEIFRDAAPAHANVPLDEAARGDRAAGRVVPWPGQGVRRDD